MINKFVFVIMIVFFITTQSYAVDYKTYNQPTFRSDRTGVTTNSGNGTLTRRSDGSMSQTKPFGNNSSITTERSSTGKIRSGVTTNSGNTSITRWNDGTVTTATKNGSQIMVKENYNNGQQLHGVVDSIGNNTRTRWSNGSTNYNRNTGKNSSFNTDKK